MTTLPAIGTYLRPVGRQFAYCLRVLRHFPPSAARSDHWRIEGERWGMDRDQHRPINDGHINPGHYIDLGPTAIPGVWRDPWDYGGYARWQCCPLYYRAIDCNAAGQKDLFA